MWVEGSRKADARLCQLVVRPECKHHHTDGGAECRKQEGEDQRHPHHVGELLHLGGRECEERKNPKTMHDNGNDCAHPHLRLDKVAVEVHGGDDVEA